MILQCVNRVCDAGTSVIPVKLIRFCVENDRAFVHVRIFSPVYVGTGAPYHHDRKDCVFCFYSERIQCQSSHKEEEWIEKMDVAIFSVVIRPDDEEGNPTRDDDYGKPGHEGEAYVPPAQIPLCGIAGRDTLAENEQVPS